MNNANSNNSPVFQPTWEQYALCRVWRNASARIDRVRAAHGDAAARREWASRYTATRSGGVAIDAMRDRLVHLGLIPAGCDRFLAASY